MDGKIQLIVGPMFSGKTTELTRRIKRFLIAQKKCMVIKYANDTRYSTDCTSTHDSQMLRANASCNKLEEADEKLITAAEIIAIDEGQFFPDLVEFCKLWADRGKICIVSALDGTFEQKPFMNVLNLIPLSEEILKLSAVCMMCGNDASFTKRLGSETEVELIGGSDKYMAVCRPCNRINLPGRLPPKE